MKTLSKLLIILSLLSLILTSCQAFKPSKVDARTQPVGSEAKARKNIEEGRGVSIKGLIKGRGSNFEFSTSNPMWRASLEILDFLPLATVDYAGGLIISDWYSDNTDMNNSLKVTVRFLTNEVQSNSLKIIIHKKKCSVDKNCRTTVSDSKIKEELRIAILKKAATFKAEQREK